MKAKQCEERAGRPAGEDIQNSERWVNAMLYQDPYNYYAQYKKELSDRMRRRALGTVKGREKACRQCRLADKWFAMVCKAAVRAEKLVQRFGQDRGVERAK